MSKTDRNEIEELWTGEIFEPEPQDEQDRRLSGPTFAEGQQRLAAALDLLTELVRKQTWRQPS